MVESSGEIEMRFGDPQSDMVLITLSLRHRSGPLNRCVAVKVHCAAKSKMIKEMRNVPKIMCKILDPGVD